MAALTARPVGAAVRPQTGPHERDHLHLTLQGDGIGGAPSGGGAGVEWQHALGARSWLVAGGYGFALGDARWAYLRLGGAAPLGARWVLHASADVGHGAQDRGSFTHRSFRLGASHAFQPGRLYGEAEERYIDIAGSHGHLLRAGAVWILGPGLALRGDVHRALGGNLRSRFWTLRVDRSIGGRAVFAGFSRGRIDAAAEDPGAASRRADGLFAGAELPWRGPRAVVSVESFKVAGQPRARVTLSLRHSFARLPVR